MEIHVNAKVARLDVDALMERAIQKTIREVFIAAGRKLLLAAIPIINQHLWTGMLRGAFRNLEDLVGAVRTESGRLRIRYGTSQSSTSNIVKGTRAKKKYYYYPPGGSRVERTPEEGRNWSTETHRIVRAALLKGRYGYTFAFKVDLAYFDYLDQKWGSMQAGLDAFVAYVNANLSKELNKIDIRPFLITETLRV